MLFTSKEEDKAFWAYVEQADRKLAEITQRKGADYNKVAAFPDYCPNGWPDSATMLWKHSLRFLQFWMHPKSVPSNETVDETLLDIMNYARYTWALRQMAEDKRRAELDELVAAMPEDEEDKRVEPRYKTPEVRGTPKVHIVGEVT